MNFLGSGVLHNFSSARWNANRQVAENGTLQAQRQAPMRIEPFAGTSDETVKSLQDLETSVLHPLLAAMVAIPVAEHSFLRDPVKIGITVQKSSVKVWIQTMKAVTD
jgi:hypothetical protein